jgi:hypothetical protein
MPNCGPPYCYDFMVYVPPGPYDYNVACQGAARDAGYSNWQYEYSCDVQQDGSGWDDYCCSTGG